MYGQHELLLHLLRLEKRTLINLMTDISTPCSHGTNDSMCSAGIGGTLGGADTSIFIRLSVF